MSHGQCCAHWVLWVTLPRVLQLGTQLLGHGHHCWLLPAAQAGSPGSPSLLPIQHLLLSPLKGCVPRALLSRGGMDIFFGHC